MKWQMACLGIFMAMSLATKAYSDCPEPLNLVQNNQPGLLTLDNVSVNPSPKRPARIPFFLPAPASKVELSVFSPDGDKLVTLSQENIKGGQHYFEWDGRDKDGVRVPYEAYTPVLTAWLKGGSNEADLTSYVDDPRDYSGGEILPDIARNWRWSGQHDISFSLDAPSRVLSRAVIEGGPLVKTIANWEARPAGKVVLRWDGYDSDKIEKVTNRDDFNVLVMAYCLPAHSLVVFGGDPDMDYQAYRKQKKMDRKRPDWDAVKLQRDGRRLEKDYFLPRNALPELSLSFPDSVEKNEAGEYIIREASQLKISIPQDQRWRIESSLYEISYFYDHKFVQEEEQGYLPFYWPIDPADFSPGRHVITVQISAFNGVFVSRSVSVISLKSD
jgi:flagellar hook assembly protein FlgD